MAAEPHPDIQELLDQLAAMGVPDFADLSVDGARSLIVDLFTVDEGLRDEVGGVQDLEIAGPNGGVPIRVYRPGGGGPHPVVVYSHGGGWVVGNLDTHDQGCRALCNAGDCVVVSVDYRLAPEHPFPAPVEDCYAATEWVADHGDLLGADTDRLVVAGDSAGGNLSAAVALLARERGGPDVAHQYLVYPVTNHAFDTDSYTENAEGYFLTRAGMEWFWDHYLETDVDGLNPLASPLRARDLSDLPPATVVTCGFDPLRDEGRAYAGRLEAAGVDVTHHHHEEMIHGFFGMLAEPDLPQAREAVATAGETIREL
ncbi:alpha/beta hydrolase [Salinigranum rubrum]|uniref:Alpha/beta hydrolase n=1 Tax=Salinigranum rubrum TaxID=755307 RepID=A0A2I8VEZ5_9EURY|nr:alpha/beta hydrolase [Salinigranum rubrum]AUV80471.1 alpha/beta hydrolase [Salinigranum rubrum]